MLLCGLALKRGPVAAGVMRAPMVWRGPIFGPDLSSGCDAQRICDNCKHGFSFPKVMP